LNTKEDILKKVGNQTVESSINYLSIFYYTALTITMFTHTHTHTHTHRCYSWSLRRDASHRALPRVAQRQRSTGLTRTLCLSVSRTLSAFFPRARRFIEAGTSVSLSSGQCSLVSVSQADGHLNNIQRLYGFKLSSYYTISRQYRSDSEVSRWDFALFMVGLFYCFSEVWCYSLCGTFNNEDALVSHIKITFNIKIKLYIVVKCLKLLSHLQTICRLVHEHTIW